MNWYPIKLTTHVRNYTFGGRGLEERLGKSGLPPGVVAETWEISDYRDTAGTVTNGHFAGRSLHQVAMTYPDELVGNGWRGPHFPLLEKFLDAKRSLPVHLHADDEIAKCKYCEPNGKTEAWHILWAAEGASILLGLKPGHRRDDLFNAFKAEDYDSVIPRFPITTGDTIYVPAGVLHSFGPDTIVFEVQQTSDLAQTVMPEDVYGNKHSIDVWERNINSTLDEIKTEFKPVPHAGLCKASSTANRYTVGCAGPYFALEIWDIAEVHHEKPHPERCMTLTNVGPPIEIEFDGGREQLACGESCIMPAATGSWKVKPTAQTKLMVCYVPDLEHDICKPLRAAGHALDEIKSVGDLTTA